MFIHNSKDKDLINYSLKQMSDLTKEEIEIITEFFDKIYVINTPVKAFFYGSRFTCYPPVEDTDVDVAIYTTGDPDLLIEFLTGLGFEESGNNEYFGIEDEFISFRKGTVNFILFYDECFFQSTNVTADFVTFHNITDKKERVEIYKLTDEIVRKVKILNLD